MIAKTVPCMCVVVFLSDYDLFTALQLAENFLKGDVLDLITSDKKPICYRFLQLEAGIFQVNFNS